jgi:hypothetical protein
MAADNTGEQQRGLPFKPGESGNPKGRPIGARNRLGSAFLEALDADFAEHGVRVIEKVRQERPHEYLKVVAGLLPKEMIIKGTALDDMTDDELNRALSTVRELLASGVRETAGPRAVTPTVPDEPGSVH